MPLAIVLISFAYFTPSVGILLISALQVASELIVPAGPMFAAATPPPPAVAAATLSPQLTSGRRSVPPAAAASTRLFLSRPRSSSKFLHHQHKQQVGHIACSFGMCGARFMCTITLLDIASLGWGHRSVSCVSGLVTHYVECHTVDLEPKSLRKIFKSLLTRRQFSQLSSSFFYICDPKGKSLAK